MKNPVSLVSFVSPSRETNKHIAMGFKPIAIENLIHQDSTGWIYVSLTLCLGKPL